MSSIEGLGLFLSRVYMDMTMPGVQKPHWDPWESAMRCWTEWSFVLLKMLIFQYQEYNGQADKFCGFQTCFFSTFDETFSVKEN